MRLVRSDGHLDPTRSVPLPRFSPLRLLLSAGRVDPVRAAQKATGDRRTGPLPKSPKQQS